VDAVAGTEFVQLQLRLRLQLQAKQIDADKRMRAHQSDHCVTVIATTPDEMHTATTNKANKAF